MIDVNELAQSAARDSNPDNQLPIELQALWHAKKGQWHEAHELCQKIQGRAGSWIHAMLHRQEGDYSNACYWYAQASKPAPAAEASLDDEWFEIATALSK